MFLGSHAINMDAKGRMAIPTKIRDSLSSISDGRIVVTAHPEERCLMVYPESQWQEIVTKIESLPSFNKATRRIQRLLIGYATPLEMDTNGRILLPPTLREYAFLEKRTMLIGQGKKFELWSEARWFDWLDSSEGDDEIPEQLSSLSL